ncbi:hypothetical protein R1flu_002280 [Riccia fluitans]|uniref:Ribose-phosphate pyrophosphokinase n=1 Tax=Riccia fluitans TaxID=41844 RepID=A0ABD1Y5T8_9MARC
MASLGLSSGALRQTRCEFYGESVNSSLWKSGNAASSAAHLTLKENSKGSSCAACSPVCSLVNNVNSWNGKPLVPPISFNGNGTLLGSRVTPQLDKSEPRFNGSRLRIFSGTANEQLAQEIACYMGLELGKVRIKRFADGEIYVQLQESVRGCDVFLVQPTCPPANENLMELLVMIDACRRASAKTITAVIPYFGYARADRKTQGRESIAAKLVANLITEAGANRVLACDLHSGQSMGYFDIPVDHVYGQPVILDYLASKMISADDLVVVSPDVGGVARARAFAKKLSDAPLAIVDKRRQGHNVSEVMNLIGDVKGKVAVMVDDMIDTAGTIANGAALLHQEGAREVYACCTHAVFSPPAIERLSGGLFQEHLQMRNLEEAHLHKLLTWKISALKMELNLLWCVFTGSTRIGSGRQHQLTGCTWVVTDMLSGLLGRRLVGPWTLKRVH